MSVEYAAQQKNLRAKANKTTGDTSKLEHFENFEVGAKTTFALLGEMAGKLFAAHRPDVHIPTGGLSQQDYSIVGRELFEDLCAAVDLPHSVIGQCINISEKQVTDSKPKKIKGGNQLKIDGSAPAGVDLDRDMMGEDDEDDKGGNKRPTGALMGGKTGKGTDRYQTEEVYDDETEADAGGAELSAEDLARIAEEDKKKREAEEAELEAMRAGLEAEERKRLLQEENEQKLKAQARKVADDVPIGMTVMKKEEDDLFGGFAGKGGKKKGGRR